MTEIMVHSPVGESFSFSDSKFKHNQSESRSHLLLDESTVIFNENMDVSSNQSSQSTICGSNSNVSLTTNDVQGSSNRTKKRNTFSEYVTSESTVISETCNVISKSEVQGMKNIPLVQHSNPTGMKNIPLVQHSNPTGMMTSDTDKSRVIVQILSSDSKKIVKSQNIVENKTTNIENQSTHSFRDDVFKILSKSQCSKINVVNNIKVQKNIKRVAPCAKARGNIKVHTSQNSSHKEDKTNFSKAYMSCKSQDVSSDINGFTQVERNRRKRGFKSYFLFGGGPKISDIQHVPSYLKAATPNALRIVHYVLYDKYGLCSNDLQVSQTKKHILCFCGYPFNKNSREYAKRVNCLQKIPRPILYEVHQAIFGKTFLKNRVLMVEQLMEFFLKPRKYNKIVEEMNQSMQFMLEKEYNKLREKALKGPHPSVSLQRLTVEDIERIQEKIKMESKHEVKIEAAEVDTVSESPPSSYALPAYILKGPGKKLQHFSSIVRNVKNAKEKNISLLHYILYGRIESESVDVCRRNILEFSGFLECQTDFIAERNATLLRLDKTELFELCKILCLGGKTNSKGCRIKKIMQYLVAPFNPIKIKRNTFTGKKLTFQRIGSSFGKYSMSDSSRPRKMLKKRRQLVLPINDSSFGSKYSMSKSSDSRNTIKGKPLSFLKHGCTYDFNYSMAESSEPRNSNKRNQVALQTHHSPSDFNCSVTESSEPGNTIGGRQVALQKHHSPSDFNYSMTESSEPRNNNKDKQVPFQRRSSASGTMSEFREFRGIQYSQTSVSNSSKETKSDGGRRLRDFRKICSNIECSAPSDLTELNDLLFAVPCDETEIHEKILNFTPFSFPDSSTDYHYRKTLMFYMGPCIVRKIAKLLNIQNWDSETSLENLSSSILNFLKQKVDLDSSCAKYFPSTVPLSSFNSNFNEEPKFEGKSLQQETFENVRNETITCKKERVHIHRLTKSSEGTDMYNSSDKSSVPSNDNSLVLSNNKALMTSSFTNGRNGICLPNCDPSKDDSVPLRVFIHHPTDQELTGVISSIIEQSLWHITLGDLVQMVYNHYPDFNLMYRETFIKTEARRMLTALRNNAFNIVHDYTAMQGLTNML